MDHLGKAGDTYVPTNDNVEQDKLRKPKPPPLVRPKMRVAIASSMMAMNILVIFISFVMLLRRGRLASPASIPGLARIFLDAHRVLAHATMARRLCELVHSDPGASRVRQSSSIGGRVLAGRISASSVAFQRPAGERVGSVAVDKRPTPHWGLATYLCVYRLACSVRARCSCENT